MSIKLCLIGGCGRMGKAIARLASEDDLFEVSGVIEHREHPNLYEDYSKITGFGSEALAVQADLEELNVRPDVIIDFSYVEATLKHLPIAATKGIPYVIGTTGIDEKGLNLVSECTKSIPVLLSPNMSLGVNVMLSAVELLTKAIGDFYNIEIVEYHHNQKVDAPSGTALKILQVIQNSLKDEANPVYGRHGMVGKRKKEEIGIHAVRGGSIVGEHCVLFAGPDEELKLVHRAGSRDTLARGALKCAEFLVNKAAGFYDMKSVLGQL